jgi:hypothetical protein
MNLFRRHQAPENPMDKLVRCAQEYVDARPYADSYVDRSVRRNLQIARTGAALMDALAQVRPEHPAVNRKDERGHSYFIEREVANAAADILIERAFGDLPVTLMPPNGESLPPSTPPAQAA